MVDVQRLRALLAAATPGEWMLAHRKSRDGYNTEVFDANGETIATLAWHAKPTRYEGELGIVSTDRPDNAALIAAVVNALPELLAIAEASEWQPIDSAPTIGVFLTFHPRFGQRILTADPHNPGWFKDATDYPTREATHWRPLPKAPEGLVRVVGEKP